MKESFRGESGFTLVELLVVVAILTVLIGIAVPNFTGLTGSGASTSKDFELNTVQSAVDAYMAVNKLTELPDGTPAPDHVRERAALITSTSADAPFKTYLRHLPTKYRYTWTSQGAVTQYSLTRTPIPLPASPII